MGDVNEMVARFVGSIAEMTGLPREVVERSEMVTKWRRWAESYFSNPIPHLERALLRRQQLIRFHERCVEKHRKAIKRIQRLIEKYGGETR